VQEWKCHLAPEKRVSQQIQAAPTVACPHCRRALSAPPSLSGGVACPYCAGAFTLAAPVALGPALAAPRPAPDGPTVRCWRCGKRCAEAEAKRRWVTTASYSGVFDLRSLLMADVKSCVDLCPACVKRHDRGRAIVNWALAVFVGFLAVGGALLAILSPLK
jgi:hypothetical protein